MDKDRFSTGLTNTFTGKVYVAAIYVYYLTRQRCNYGFIYHTWFSWNTDSLIYAYNASVIRLLNISPMIKHMPHISERSCSCYPNNLPTTDAPEINKNVNPTVQPVYLQGCRHATQHVPQKDFRQVYNIRRTLVGNTIVHHSDACSWSIACRRCSNCIFIIDLTLGFNIFGKDNCQTRWEKFYFGDLERLILDSSR